MVDRRTDVFAVGVMLWEALAGRRMWPDLGEVMIVQRLRAAEIPALPATAAGGPELRALCERALAVDPRGRPATAGEFAEALAEHSPDPRGARRQLGIMAVCSSSAYLGAVRDAEDAWATATWTRWD